MSQVHAMSDDQVAAELRKMTAFIRQEAMEKAQEIKFKADEEFQSEKASLVQSETNQIDAEYEKKFKQAGMSQQITASTLANKTRLRLLSARQELLDELFEKAQGELSKFTKDEKKYQKLLKDLLLEAFYAMNEKKLSVRSRKADQSVVQKAIEDAKKEYKDKLKKDLEVSIDEKERIPDDSAGGVIVLNGTGKIDINNTFEERLHLLETDGLPSVRQTLFGDNKNRKFKD